MSEWLGYLIGLIGSTVMYGWVAGVDALTRINPSWVSMKFSTALGFVLSSFIIIAAARVSCKDSKKSELVIFTSSILILIIMFQHGFTYLYGQPNYFMQIIADSDPDQTALPGLPSIVTILCFHLVAIWGKCFVFRSKFIKWLSLPIFIMGLTAFLGYCLGDPFLYGYVPERYTGMAFHTAIAFMIIGFALYNISLPPKTPVK